MSGRKRHNLELFYKKKKKKEKGNTGSRAICKACRKEMLVQRLKNHHEKCKRHYTYIKIPLDQVMKKLI